MRLLMTTDTVGGVWNYSTELVQGLLEQGSCVALVTLGRTPSAAQQQWLEQCAARWGDAFTWQEMETPLEWMNMNDSAYSQAAPDLLVMASAFGAELLHSNQLCFGALPIDIPKVVVAHSDVLSWSAACAHPIDPCPWLERYIALTSEGLRGADAVVTPTQWMLNALQEAFSIPCESYVIANGRSVRRANPNAPRKLQAITAGRLWDKAKNLSVLKDVTLPFPLLVAGDNCYQGNFAPALPPNAVPMGTLVESELLTLFRQSAIYICTSRYEPFGLAPLEAALCGCAVVANDIHSMREVWGSCALYFDGAEGLSTILEELASAPEQLAAAQHRSWRHAQNYTGLQMTNRYLRLYQNMLAKTRTSAYVA